VEKEKGFGSTFSKVEIEKGFGSTFSKVEIEKKVWVHLYKGGNKKIVKRKR
jgi:hypothetical protein